MRRAKILFDEVKEAQLSLGTGEVEEALARAEPLRTEAAALMERPGLTSFERTYARGSFVYATVTLILGAAEALPPAESVPRIRDLATEMVRRHDPRMETWKVLAAAAEMLARAGDALGAVWAAKKAVALGPGDDYLIKLAGGIQSMYPQVYAEAPDEPPDEPPPLPSR